MTLSSSQMVNCIQVLVNVKLPAHKGNVRSCELLKFVVLYLKVGVTLKALSDFRCMLFVSVKIECIKAYTLHAA